jgi:hypothetical protein
MAQHAAEGGVRPILPGDARQHLRFELQLGSPRCDESSGELHWYQANHRPTFSGACIWQVRLQPTLAAGFDGLRFT